MAALKASGNGLGGENEREEDEEELEEILEVFFLEIYGVFLFEGFFEMELDYGVECLDGCFFGD